MLTRFAVDFNQQLQNPAISLLSDPGLPNLLAICGAQKITNQNWQNKVQGKSSDPPREGSSKDDRLNLLEKQQEKCFQFK